jgi:drug/metabolite transporter (DMT)-like permease
MRRHHPALGITFMLCGCFMLTLNDAINKLLTSTLTISQLIYAKSLLVVVALLLLTPWLGAMRVFTLADWKGQAIRSGLTVLSSFLFLLGLTALPLSTTVTLGFVNPLYITALAPWILGEKVDSHRWAAVVIGFVGVTIIAWPTAGGFSYAVLYPLASALCGAFRDMMTRRMTLRSTTESMVFYSMLTMTVAGGVATKGDIFSISSYDWLLLAIAAIMSLIALYLQVEAMRNAEAATIAPFKYSNLVWVTILDVLIWQHFPTWNVFAGASVIITAMLYIYHRERRLAARMQAVSPNITPSSLG